MATTKTINCPLCCIPTKEAVIHENDIAYLVSTRNQKGHKVRVMAVIKRHTSTPTHEEKLTVYDMLYNYMTNLMKNQVWYIVSSKYASVPEHFHVIACDLPMEEEEDPLFATTPKIMIRTK